MNELRLTFTLDTVGTGGRPLSAPIARSRPLAAGILEALGAFRPKIDSLYLIYLQY